MEKTEFFMRLAEMLDEKSPLTEETRLVDLKAFDSLSVIALMAMVDAKFGVLLNVKALAGIDTVGSLMDIIGRERFSG